MQLGMVGLGRMGANMVRRLMAGGHECVVYDRNPASVEDLIGGLERPAIRKPADPVEPARKVSGVC